MIKVGDILIARESFYQEHSFPKEEREFRVTDYDGSTSGGVETLDGASFLRGHIDFYRHFYIESNINIELRNLLDSGIELASFTGKTVDGKIIEIKGELKQNDTKKTNSRIHSDLRQ